MRVAITGLGAHASVGGDVASIWDSVLKGRTGIGRISRFDATGYESPFAAEIRGGDAGLIEHAVIAAREAWTHAGLRPCAAAVITGTSAGPIRARGDRAAVTRHDAIAAAVATAVGASGAQITASTACASGNVALGLARELIRSGRAEVVLTGGADAFAELRYAGFHALGAIAPGPCAPFSTPEGMTLGEGAAFLVIESLEHARARGATVLALLSGYGGSADGHHATAPDPRGAGMARAMDAALADAELRADDISLYNAHGTGTASNDAAEWQAMLRVFGARARTIPATAPKSIFGHTFGGAGALEAILSVLAIRDQRVPPTPTFAGLEGRSNDGPGGLSAAARTAEVRHVLSHNAAFGGANAAVIISAVPALEHATMQRRAVYLHAVATATPDDPLLSRLPVRGLDPIARATIAAIARAAKDAHVELGRRGHERCGCFSSVIERPAASTQLYEDAFYDRGPLSVSPEAFSRTVMCAAAGAATRVLGLRGPTATLSSGSGGGAQAVGVAAMLLAHRNDADAYFAGEASDERATFAYLSTTPATDAIPLDARTIDALILANAATPEPLHAQLAALIAKLS